MSGFLVLLRKEIKEQFKTSKVIIVAAVFLFFGLGTPLLTKYTPILLESVGSTGTGGITIEMPEPTSSDSLLEYSSTMAQFGVLMAVLVAMGAIAKEAETGTAAMVLSKPVGRQAFILAKLQAEVFTFFLAFLLGGLACWGYTLILFGDANVLGFLSQNLLLLLFFVLCLMVTLFFSALMKNQLAAGGLALASLIGISAFSALPLVGRYLPSTLISWGNRLVLNQSGDSEWWAVMVTAALIVLGVYCTWLIMRKKEL
jgi:ABC-2 type transport system permease protein